MEGSNRSVEAVFSLGNRVSSLAKDESGMEASLQKSNQDVSIFTLTNMTAAKDKDIEEGAGRGNEDIFEERNIEKPFPSNPPEILTDISFNVIDEHNNHARESIAQNNAVSRPRFIMAAPPELLRDIFLTANKPTNQRPDVCCYSKNADKVSIPELDVMERHIAEMYEDKNESNVLIEQMEEAATPAERIPIDTNAISARAQPNRARNLFNDKASFAFQVFLLAFTMFFVISYFLLLVGTRKPTPQLEA